MKNWPFNVLKAACTLLVLCAFLVLPASAGAQGPQGLTSQEAQEIALDAYIYGYSLITTEVTRVQMSNVAKVEELRAPTGTFFNIKRYPPETYRGVSAPNADTLYSVAWLDLSEPQVFSHPEIKGRFFTFELVDLWMIVKDSVGTNTSGSKSDDLSLYRPGLERDGTSGHDAYQLPDALHGHIGSHLRAGHERRPGEGACPAGAVQGQAPVGLR
jgi:hypothetical protein